MSEHTPGPWIADGGSRIQGANAKHMYNICHMDGVPMHIESPTGTDCKAMTRANARLISAAPDLLAACEGAVQIIEQLIPEPSVRGVADVVLHQLRAAIAAAKGAIG